MSLADRYIGEDGGPPTGKPKKRLPKSDIDNLINKVFRGFNIGASISDRFEAHDAMAKLAKVLRNEHVA